MATIESGALGSLKPKTNNVEKFTLDANKKYRIGFPLLTDDGQGVRIDKVPFWNKFDDTIKIKTLTTGDDEFDSKVSKVLGSPVVRYATPVVIYETDDNGTVSKPLRYKLMPFVFSDGTLADLISINSEFPLHEHDVTMTLKSGSDPKYQNMVPLPTSKEAIWKNEKIIGDITDKAKQMIESGVLYEAVAKKMSQDDLAVKLGLNESKNANQQNTPDDDLVEVDIDIDSIV